MTAVQAMPMEGYGINAGFSEGHARGVFPQGCLVDLWIP
jgi:hypothetical protein